MSNGKNNEGIKALFYEDGATIVCLLLEKAPNGRGRPTKGVQKVKVVARGISVASVVDDMDVEDGQLRAYRRAMEARGRQADCQPIDLYARRGTNYDWLSLSLAKDRYGKFKGYYNPKLTKTEEILLSVGGKQTITGKLREAKSTALVVV